MESVNRNMDNYVIGNVDPLLSDLFIHWRSILKREENIKILSRLWPWKLDEEIQLTYIDTPGYIPITSFMTLSR